MNTLAGLLENSPMFRLFVEEVCAVPHPSGYEELLLQRIDALARTKGYEVRRDEARNLALLVPGRGKYANTKRGLLVQCHGDMVPKKLDSVQHDFEKDPIRVVLEDGYLRASGTTLGSDNGLGLAAALAVAFDDNLETPPLVILVTVREETDMHGAKNLDPSLVFPDQVTLVGGLNLDSEEGVEEVYCGCAGGAPVTSVKLRKPENIGLSQVGYTGFTLLVHGLSGGHSGLEIDKCHLNAVRVAAEFLQQAQWGSVILCDGKGGTKQNSIPTQCQFRGYMDTVEFDRLTELLPDFMKRLRTRVVKADEEVKVVLTYTHPIHLPNTFWNPEESLAIIDFLNLVPEGLLAIDQLVNYKLPRTSSNLGVFFLDGQRCEVTNLVRSSVDAERDLIVQRINLLGGRLLFESTVGSGFPAWPPDSQNPVLLAAEKLWSSAFGCQLKRMVTHGGLECGELGKRLNGLPMISLGGVIKRAHEPDEHADVESWLQVETGVKYLLCNLVEAMSA